MVPLVAFAALTVTGCSTQSGDVPVAPAAGGTPITVTSATGMPYTFADGAQARKQADALCGTGGVRTSIYDRFADGAWTYPEGCA